MRWILWLTASSLLTACSTSSATPDAGGDSLAVDASIDSGQPPDVAIPDATRDADDSGPCVEAVELVVHSDPLGPIRVFAKVLKDGEPVALLVDTGSQLTFLSTPDLPDGTPDVGQIDFGCGPRSLLGRPHGTEGEEAMAGMPVVGYLGSDFFLEAPTRLDLVAGTLGRIDRTAIAPQSLRLPFDDVHGFLFVDVQLDETPVKLAFDTGAPHSLWIGVAGKPGDTPYPTQDGYGTPITLHLGTTVLSSEHITARTVPVIRGLEFKSIQDSNKAMGIDAQGLFGLTSIPSPSFVIDAQQGVIWLEVP